MVETGLGWQVSRCLPYFSLEWRLAVLSCLAWPALPDTSSMDPPPPKGQQQTLFDQALLLDESDSMFAFLDHMVSGGGPEAAAGPMLYGPSGDLGDAALAGPPLTWAGPLAASQPWGAPGQPFDGAPAKPVKEELDQRERSGSGSGDRSSGDTTAEPNVSRKSDMSLRSKADKLHLAREKVCGGLAHTLDGETSTLVLGPAEDALQRTWVSV